MNLQQERIDGHCQSLKLEGLMHRYVALASDAAAKQWSFLDFLETCLLYTSPEPTRLSHASRMPSSA